MHRNRFRQGGGGSVCSTAVPS